MQNSNKNILDRFCIKINGLSIIDVSLLCKVGDLYNRHCDINRYLLYISHKFGDYESFLIHHGYPYYIHNYKNIISRVPLLTIGEVYECLTSQYTWEI